MGWDPGPDTNHVAWQAPIPLSGRGENVQDPQKDVVRIKCDNGCTMLGT